MAMPDFVNELVVDKAGDGESPAGKGHRMMNSDRIDELADSDLRAQAYGLGVPDADTMSRESLLAVLRDTDGAMTRSEERLVASTQVYQTGRARLRKYVITEQVQITVEVRREELRIEREPLANGEQTLVEDPDVFGSPGRFDGRDGGMVYEVVLHEERPVISTEIVPVERVRLSTVVQTEQRTLSGQVRKEQIEVDIPGQTPSTLG